MSYAIAAYAVVLAGVAGYALYLGRERRTLERALRTGEQPSSANRG